MSISTDGVELEPTPGNLSGGIWLLADMALNIWALTIVKVLGLDYAAVQLVFLRASIGLTLMIPWALHQRACFLDVDRLPLHALRVVFSALALTTSFFAISRLPFALVTAIGFTRPIVMMVMAALILHELIPRQRWIAVGIGFVGVLVAVEPANLQFDWSLPAMFLTVIFGTSAIIVTRRLSSVPRVVMMTFYTIGLALLTAPWALFVWAPINSNHLLPLLAIGAFAQCAQFCFLIAHQRAQAGFLAILGYLSLPMTAGIGYLIFDEIPTWSFAAGAALIVGATATITLSAVRARHLERISRSSSLSRDC